MEFKKKAILPTPFRLCNETTDAIKRLDSTDKSHKKTPPV